jgi:tetratricopeptide (TPR) repeat protein
MNRLQKLVLGVCLLVPLNADAVEGSAFMKVPQGARSSAMGSAFGSVPGSVEALWYNPATLGGLQSFQATFSHLSWFEGVNTEYLAAGYTAGNSGHGLGLFLRFDNATDIARDNTGVELRDFSISNMAAGLAWGKRFGNVNAGITGKILNQSIDNSRATGYAADLGFSYMADGDKAIFSMAVQNLGSSASLGTGNSEEAAPFALRGGIALREYLSGTLLTLETVHWSVFRTTDILAGLEYGFNISAIKLSTRLGYDSGAAPLGGLGGFTLGAGFNLAGLQFDYAFIPSEKLGAAHRASLSWVPGGAGQLKTKDLPQWSQAARQAEAPVDPGEESTGTQQTHRLAAEAYRAKKYTLAAKYFQKLVQMKPKSAGAWKGLGMSLYRSGNKKNGLRAIYRALELDPSLKKLKKWYMYYLKLENDAQASPQP